MVAAQDWQAERYATHAGFVAELGAPLLELLAPVAGERVLDLGCGDGALTVRLRDAGCRVVGVDAAPDMVREARARGLDARVLDAHDLPFQAAFEAVLSNAALHWMKRDPNAVLAGVARALVPGGRLVAELGGHGNVAALRAALHAVVRARGIDPETVDPWFFPTVEDYRRRLEHAGFEVETLALIPRPTPLPTDLRGWLATFAAPFLSTLPADETTAALEEVEGLLRPVLRDREGRWTADYVRLRLRARRA
jgi:SAM-dependent methyltransferase